MKKFGTKFHVSFTNKCLINLDSEYRIKISTKVPKSLMKAFHKLCKQSNLEINDRTLLLNWICNHQKKFSNLFVCFG